MLTGQLGDWVHGEGEGLGVAFDATGGFTLPNGAVRSPDSSPGSPSTAGPR